MAYNMLGNRRRAVRIPKALRMPRPVKAPLVTGEGICPRSSTRPGNEKAARAAQGLVLIFSLRDS